MTNSSNIPSQTLATIDIESSNYHFDNKKNSRIESFVFLIVEQFDFRLACVSKCYTHEHKQMNISTSLIPIFSLDVTFLYHPSRSYSIVYMSRYRR
jgi:hypothetical protein